MTEANFKARVVENFSRSASTYDCHAEEQRVGAATLAECAAECAGNLVEGPVLEIGCGTGFLSASLAALFPERRLELTDIAPAMVAHCRQKMAAEVVHPDLCYRVLDGEQLVSEGRYALICASFVVHWFADLCAGLHQLLAALKPGGRLLCSYPGAGSYAEWHRQCVRQGVPCSANALPDLASVARVFANESVAVRPMGTGARAALSNRPRLFASLQGHGSPHVGAAECPWSSAIASALARLGSRLSQRRGDYVRYSLFSSRESEGV